MANAIERTISPIGTLVRTLLTVFALSGIAINPHLLGGGLNGVSVLDN
jgi:hypothetical protein